MTAPFLVVTALRSEQAALHATLPDAILERCGMGPDRVRAWLPRLTDIGPRAVAVAGVAGGLDPSLRPGDVVVATEVRDAMGRTVLRAAAPLVAELRRQGMRVRSGPIVSTDHIVNSTSERERLAATGAIAVDMESAAIVRALAERPGQIPVAVVRVVVDTAYTPVARLRTLPAGAKALLTLRRTGPALSRWAGLAGPRQVLLAAPRSFCAGVERAIEIVELALQRYSRPIYVRRQIVHNAHVVGELQQRGAVFVDEVDEVPAGSVLVFSAHGVSSAVRRDAAAGGGTVIDATCPLVTKVHSEIRRYAKRDNTVFLIGHADHEEVQGSLGEAPDDVIVVPDVDTAHRVAPRDPSRVAYTMQTTLAVDEAEEIAGILRGRFPTLSAPRTDDICYATTNRQRAVRAIAREVDLVLVVGSPNSSNSVRLVEVAQREGVPAYLVDDVTEIDLRWLVGTTRVGVTAGASAPPHLVDEIVHCLGGLGPVTATESRLIEEDVTFALPREVV
jgi:4-hydroxy-3-methylbut-2-enyl diphosphate reductase